MSETPNIAALITDLFFAPPQSRLEVEDGRIKIKHWRTEADLRGQLARLAFAYGWNVQEEVVVPGWGRIDIILGDPDAPAVPILIELKVELVRPADVRKAFQQADGYGRWWKANKEQRSEVVLCAASHDEAVVRPAADAYPEVSFYPAATLMGLFAHWRSPHTKRWTQARARLDAARRALDVHERAVADIEQIEQPS